MLKLTVGVTNDARIQPLTDGTIKPENIELDFVFTSPGELHYRNLKYDEFDVFQMSISESIMVKDRADGSRWQWSGLPVFPSKAFLWLNLFVNDAAEIKEPSDLKNKRVGVPDYPMTAALWMRIFLRELYGIAASDITWYNGRTKNFSHGAIFNLDKNPPPGVSIQWLSDKQTLDVLLDSGKLDAAFGFPPRHATRDFNAIDRYGQTPIAGNPRIRKLFADHGRQIISEYHKRTGVLPSNHMFMIQRTILERHPWVALELYKAFERAKEVAYENARRACAAYLLFEGDDYKDQVVKFGEDPYPYGVRENRKMLELLFRGSFEEGLTRRLVKIEDIFHPAVLDT